MPRSLWKGTLSFGLVTIPVQLFAATQDKSPAFNQLRASDHSRIGYQRVAKADGTEVAYDEIVKGYEYAKDHYVVFDADELAGLKPASSRTICSSGVNCWISIVRLDAGLSPASSSASNT